MADHPKPIVVLSKCLELEACRYNGMSIKSDIVRRLLPHADIRPVCPEVEIGLGTPREPIRLVGSKEDPRLFQPSTGRDLTEAMKTFADTSLAELQQADGFILKSRSPSCGIKDTKIHRGESDPSPAGKGAGLFAAAVLERFPDAAIEDEGRLTNFRLRHHFLTKIFLRARFREITERHTMAALVGFHAANKFLLMAYHQTEMRNLGRIVANPKNEPIDEVHERYEAGLGHALARPARLPANINVLQHVLGYFSDGLSPREKAHFLDSLTEYRGGRVTMEVPLSIIHQWLARFRNDYIANQVFLQPYPRELMGLGDSGRN